MLTLHDLTEKLKQIDEISLLEVLEINSEDLVDRFEDRIETKFEELSEEFIDDNEKDEDETNRKIQENKRKPKDSIEDAYEEGDYDNIHDVGSED